MLDKFYDNPKIFTALKYAAFGIGLYGIGFRQISLVWPVTSFKWFQHEIAVRIHFLVGPFVLIIGIFQFQKNLRSTRPQLHRWIGRFYIFFQLLSAATVFSMVFDSAYGWIPVVSLFVLNILWIVSLIIAVFYIAVKRDFQQHRFWMIRNYALTCSAITLRIFLLSLMKIIGFELAYQIACANSFVWNMFVAEYAIRKIQQDEIHRTANSIGDAQKEGQTVIIQDNSPNNNKEIDQVFPDKQ